MKNSADFHHCVRSKADFTVWHLAVRFSKDSKTLRARKAILETPTRLLCEAGLFFSYVVKGINIKITDTEHLRFEDTKRIMSPEQFRDFRETGP